jgi:hypothetical protein
VGEDPFPEVPEAEDPFLAVGDPYREVLEGEGPFQEVVEVACHHQVVLAYPHPEAVVSLGEVADHCPGLVASRIQPRLDMKEGEGR